ncbi:MAG TPA: hypothetical protein VFY93_00645 [Planctomycetota bacterium]|nr:hypothetical protein [Planctomycetota bacterium]
MRLAVLGSVVILAIGIQISHRSSQARVEGREEAAEAIAKGRPRLRRAFETSDRLPPDGIGIDRDTGLPLQNTTHWCANCRWQDFFGGARDAAYNERILEALAAGKLDRFRLRHKLRTKDQIASLFSGVRPDRLEADGAVLSIGRGAFDITYHHDVQRDDNEFNWLIVSAGGTSELLRLSYPTSYVDRPGSGRRGSRGPYDAVVADDETSLILRDADGYAWVIDLPGGLVVEVAGPIP